MDSILDTALQIYFITVIGFIGLVIGSFLNVAALRLLSGENMVFARSKCPKCNTKIAWYDNIPVLSYMILGAKCRHCKEKISIQYPIVEATTGALFIALFLAFGISLKTFFLMILVSLLIVITVTDLKEQLIYDVTSIPLIPLGLIYSFFDIGVYGSGYFGGIKFIGFVQESFLYAILGAIAGACIFEIFARLGKIFMGERAFGEGDTILAAGLGAWFGIEQLFLIIILSLLFQVLVGIPIIISNMLKEKDYKSIFYTMLMVLSLVIPYIGNLTGVTETQTGALAVMITALTFAGIGAFSIIEGAKKRQSFTFIPFGPALVFGAIVAIFWGKSITDFYMSAFIG